ncbi:MAG: T9SS type A sorting domain-containing protein, partial [Saprospiraceae bacterium]|nr:T9SS type A sorting domain-containing protein [Saprospiraceae bacterium]
TIYESIVNRRQDPSILTKTSATQYELKVFPMAGNQTRKVKITYLIPAQWDSRYVSATFPTSILQTSKNPVDDMPVLVWPNQDFSAPNCQGYPEVTFEQRNDPVLGYHFLASIPKALFNQPVNVSFANPMVNGFYLRKHGTGEDGIYQLAVMPDKFAPEPTRKKWAVLIDYDHAGGTITVSSMLAQIKIQLLSALGPSDSFNLIFSNLPIHRVSDVWLPANESTIEAVFASLNNPVSNFSNLPVLIADGIDFIQDQNTGGSMILFSNSAQFNTSQTANEVINYLLTLMSPKIPIHVVDYRTTSTPTSNIGGISYIGNEYMLFTLSQQTTASYQKSRTASAFSSALSACFKNAAGIIQPFDFYTTLEDGICYGRFYVNSEPTVGYVGQAITQLGKYTGSFPFKIALAGEVNGQFFSHEIEVQEAPEIVGDTLIREMWYGKFIQLLESQPSSTNTIFETIHNSLSERVLSRYTAFLCLENPDYYCDDCVDETNFTDVDDLQSDSLLYAYPNPFVDQVTITLKEAASVGGKATFEVFALDGKLIERQVVLATGANYEWKWMGVDLTGKQAPSGMYLVTVEAGSRRAAVKIMKR